MKFVRKISIALTAMMFFAGLAVTSAEAQRERHIRIDNSRHLGWYKHHRQRRPVIVSYRSYPRYYTSESYYSKGYYPRYVRYRSYPSYTRVYPRYRTVTYAPTYVYPRYRSYRRYPDSSGINIISALAHGATSVGENYQALLVNTMSLERLYRPFHFFCSGRLPAGPFES